MAVLETMKLLVFHFVNQFTSSIARYTLLYGLHITLLSLVAWSLYTCCPIYPYVCVCVCGYLCALVLVYGSYKLSAWSCLLW